MLEVLKDILNSPQITSMLYRTKVTNGQAVGVLSQALKLGGADLNKFKISKSGTHRKRKQNRHKLANKTEEDFKAKKPKFAAIH